MPRKRSTSRSKRSTSLQKVSSRYRGGPPPIGPSSLISVKATNDSDNVVAIRQFRSSTNSAMVAFKRTLEQRERNGDHTSFRITSTTLVLNSYLYRLTVQFVFEKERNHRGYYILTATNVRTNWTHTIRSSGGDARDFAGFLRGNQSFGDVVLEPLVDLLHNAKSDDTNKANEDYPETLDDYTMYVETPPFS